MSRLRSASRRLASAGAASGSVSSSLTVLAPLASGAPLGAAFPRRSSLAPQSRRRRAPPARSSGLSPGVFDQLGQHARRLAAPGQRGARLHLRRAGQPAGRRDHYLRAARRQRQPQPPPEPDHPLGRITRLTPPARPVTPASIVPASAVSPVSAGRAVSLGGRVRQSRNRARQQPHPGLRDLGDRVLFTAP